MGTLLVSVGGLGATHSAWAQAPVVRAEPGSSTSRGANGLTIHVTDSSGAPVQDAAVQVAPVGGQAADPLWTDGNGVVSLPSSRGSYEVRVLAQGFMPTNTTVDVRGSGPQSLTLILKPPSAGENADGSAGAVMADAPAAETPRDATAAIVTPRYFAVHVTGANGAVIPNAQVRIDLPGRDEAEPLHTDANGFASASEPEGHYHLTVTATGFAPLVKEIDVKASATEGLVIPLQLQAPMAEVSPSVPAEPVTYISPSRPIPTGLAPGMKFRLVSDGEGANVFALIFSKGDEVLSGLTDFCISHNVMDAHFQAVGAVSGATLGWLDLSRKEYRAIPVREQAEVLSMMGDVAEFNGKPVVHAHVVLGRQDGSTVGGHLWEAHVDPTLEVFLTVNPHPLQKVLDPESGMKVIDPGKPAAP